MKILKGASASTDIPQWGQTARPTHGGLESVAIPSFSSGVLTLDVAAGNYHVTPTINANLTDWAWANMPISGGVCLTVAMLMGGTLRTVADPEMNAAVHWMTPKPVHKINKYTFYNLVTLDGGANCFIWASVEEF